MKLVYPKGFLSMDRNQSKQIRNQYNDYFSIYDNLIFKNNWYLLRQADSESKFCEVSRYVSLLRTFFKLFEKFFFAT